MLAAKMGRVDCVFSLLTDEIGMQNSKGETALIYACNSGKYECAELLLSEIGIADNNGKTPF